MAMKQYKITLGFCGGTFLTSNVIKAQNEREAVIKYLNSQGDEVTEEEINKYIEHVYEHHPVPRKKKA